MEQFTVSQQLTDVSPLSAGSKRLESLIKSALRFKPPSCHQTKKQKETANRPLTVQVDSPSLSKVIQIIYLQGCCVHSNRTLGQRCRYRSNWKQSEGHTREGSAAPLKHFSHMSQRFIFTWTINTRTDAAGSRVFKMISCTGSTVSFATVLVLN